MRTVSELQDALDEDLAWRRSELHSFLGSVRRANSDSVTQRALCRAGVPILYAHWEGYSKFCLSAYLKFVGRRKMTYAELHPAFVALALEASLDSRQGVSHSRKLIHRVATLLNEGSTRPQIPWKKGVDTQSNLNSERCFDLFASLGLDSNPIHLKAHLIDYELLRARNEIAHGQYLNVDARSYEELHHEIISMIEFVRNTVSAAAENGAYRRSF